MLNFKSCLNSDMENVFLNTDEFATQHIVNGKLMNVMVDKNELLTRNKEKDFRPKDTLIYVKKSEFGNMPSVNGIVTLDGNKYVVKDVTNESGIYAITLTVNIH